MYDWDNNFLIGAVIGALIGSVLGVVVYHLFIISGV
jgi:glycerol uptake facilitator-like aquaporin